MINWLTKLSIALLMTMAAVVTYAVESAELTEAQKKFVDGRVAAVLAHPRETYGKALNDIAEIGNPAIRRAAPELAKLLDIPLQEDPQSGFDPLYMQVLRMLRESPPLSDDRMERLRILSHSKNADMAIFAKMVYDKQLSLQK